MKHCYLFIFFFCILWGAKAAPGDTTVVQSHTNTQLANFGNYNAPAVFPATSPTFRNIIMTFTLGKYQCPGSPQYCGDWDYGVQIFLFTPTDTFEIGRLITPYANVSRFPWNWQHRYNFDVTDYAQYLKGNTNIRIAYSGYSGGFTANVKFTFIEGTPPRNVVKISRLWNGSFGYGGTAVIESKMNNRALTMPAGAQSAVLRFNVTGHGGNANDNCAEFCSKYYRVNLNGNLIAQKDIWRNNCGSNNLYPQTGTWVYERANWCPGDVVYPNYHPLGGLTAGSNYNLDVDFQAYNNPSSTASYTVEGQVIYYGAYNYTTDAAMEAIIAPNDYEGYFRSNPTCDEAKIKVKNTGNTTINSLEFSYGVIGNSPHTFPVIVSIQPGETEEIVLPGNTEFISMGTAVSKFTAQITKVNGTPDANLQNNVMQSSFTPMPVWPNQFIIRLTTNSGGFSANTWKIYDANGNIVRQRINTANVTAYADTLSMPVGCYRLVVDDKACNGLQWWAAPSQGSGSLLVRYKNTNQPIALKGYFNGDFGCGFNQAFRVQTALGVKEDKAAFNVSVYPNPAQSTLNVAIEQGQNIKEIKVALLNSIGQEVYQANGRGAKIQIPVQNLPAGIYILKCQMDNRFVQKQIEIAR
jgi:hypothetical protein